MSSSVKGVGGTDTMYRKHCIKSAQCETLDVAWEVVPRDSAGTLTVACKLCRDGSKFRLPSRSLVACA